MRVMVAAICITLPVHSQGIEATVRGRIAWRTDPPPVGWIRGTIGLPDGTLVVLDEERGALVRLSNRGEVRGTGAGLGHQPGQLAIPRAMTATRGGRIVVHDAMTETLSWFRVRDTSIAFERRATIERAGFALCAMGDSIVLLGRESRDPMDETPPLHLIAPDGRLLRTFGRAFGDYTPFSQIALQVGHVVCQPRARRVIVASELYPEVRAYDVDGSERWYHKLAGFEMISITEQSDRSNSIGFPPSGRHHFVASLFVVSDSVLAVQIALRIRGQRRGEIRGPIETRFIAATTGRIVAPSRTDIPLITWRDGDAALGYRNAPTPEISVIHIRSSRLPGG